MRSLDKFSFDSIGFVRLFIFAADILLLLVPRLEELLDAQFAEQLIDVFIELKHRRNNLAAVGDFAQLMAVMVEAVRDFNRPRYKLR